MIKMPIKTGVIGYGYSAKTFHIPFIETLPEFELSAISSSQTSRVKNELASTQHYLTADELIKKSEVSLVIITAPNDVHFSLAELALQNNKHVVLEKPFVTSSKQGEVLIKLAKQKGLVLTVYQNRRWDGDFLTVQKLINEKRLGNIKHFESHFDRFRPNMRSRWRETAADGGGILFDLGPHLIDQALQLFGMPHAITAHCKTMRKGSTNTDLFNITLHYPNMLAVLHASLFFAGINKRFTVQGDLGSYEKTGLDPQEDCLKQGVLPTSSLWANETQEECGRIYDGDSTKIIKPECGCYQDFFKGVANAICNDMPSPVKAEDALKTITLIELALKSSYTNKTLFI